jgi:hypothetical protein
MKTATNHMAWTALVVALTGAQACSDGHEDPGSAEDAGESQIDSGNSSSGDGDSGDGDSDDDDAGPVTMADSGPDAGDSGGGDVEDAGTADAGEDGGGESKPKLFAYTALLDEGAALFVGSSSSEAEPEMVAPKTYADILPQWRADGRELLYVTLASGGLASLDTMVLPVSESGELGTPKPLYDSPPVGFVVAAASYSPDGRFVLAKLLNPGDSTVRWTLRETAGQNPELRPIGEGGTAIVTVAPAWAPNSAALALIEGDFDEQRVSVVELAGATPLTREVLNLPAEDGTIGAPVWSDTSTGFAFRVTDTRVYWAAASGGELATLLSNPDRVAGAPTFRPQSDVVLYDEGSTGDAATSSFALHARSIGEQGPESVQTVWGPADAYRSEVMGVSPISDERVLFIADVSTDDVFELWVGGTSGVQPTKLAGPQSTEVFEFVYGAGEQAIVIQREADWSARNLSVVELDGPELFPLTTFAAGSYAWLELSGGLAPNHSGVFYNVVVEDETSQDAQMFYIRLGTNPPLAQAITAQLPDGARASGTAAWSNDATHFAFSGDLDADGLIDLALVELAEGVPGEYRVVATLPAESTAVHQIAWQP